MRLPVFAVETVRCVFVASRRPHILADEHGGDEWDRVAVYRGLLATVITAGAIDNDFWHLHDRLGNTLYDQFLSVVYSFGLVLLAFCDEAQIAKFVVELALPTLIELHATAL
jgi:hypothetical protein